MITAQSILYHADNISTPRCQCYHAEMLPHYDDVIMGTIASQIASLTIVYSTVYSGADQSKHQSSASLAFVWGIHRGPVNSPHKWPVTRKMFPFDDVIMIVILCSAASIVPRSTSVIPSLQFVFLGHSSTGHSSNANEYYRMSPVFLYICRYFSFRICSL